MKKTILSISFLLFTNLLEQEKKDTMRRDIQSLTLVLDVHILRTSKPIEHLEQNEVIEHLEHFKHL